MAESDERPPTLAGLRLKTNRRKRTGWEPELFLFDEPSAQDPPPPPPEPPLPARVPVAPAPLPPPSAPVDARVWTVRALVTHIRQAVESGYTDLRIQGEISNLRAAPSGHLYFTLKDGEAQLPVVLFRRQAALVRFRPKDGDEIEARGRVSVYESRGQLQMIAEHLALRGAGAMQVAFERLKARLLAEGLFDQARKRALPAFPRCIGIVTSVSGAVIRDIVTVGRRRHARFNLLVYPAVMQGAACAGSVAAGIRWFNAHADRADIIVIARGGGSFEDLAGFNDEGLARAIAASALPVVSAIGHETDFTIADFVADLRAPTPSAAAEIVTAAQHRIEERVQALHGRSGRAIRFLMLAARQRYARLSTESVLGRLRDAVGRRDQRLDDLRGRLEAAAGHGVRRPATRLAALETRLRRQDIRLRLAAVQRRLESANARLGRAGQALLAARQRRMSRADSRLEALSPVAVLKRGYALVYSAEGVLLTEGAQVRPGQSIRARLASGSLTATVTENLES